jgi:hypothetical protein
MVSEVEFPGSLDTHNLELRSYASIDASALLTLIDRNREQLIQSFAPIAKDVVRTTDADACQSPSSVHGRHATLGLLMSGNSRQPAHQETVGL